MNLDNEKRLSILITARDDDYMLDFRYRITTTMNYIIRHLKQLGRQNDVEILVVDWGSAIPLSQTLPLFPEARQICRFIYVSPDIVRSVQNGKEDFHTTMSVNAGLRRALGQFVMVYAADTLISQQSLETILRLLDGALRLPISVDRAYFMFSRSQVPLHFVQRQGSLDEWDRYLLLHAGEISRGEATLLSASSGAGALMMHRLLWHELRGFDERLGNWGGSDVELGLRVTQRCPWVELSNMGISLFHMEHSPSDGRAFIVKQRSNPSMFFNPTFQINDENWGLGHYELEIQMPQNTYHSEGDKIPRADALGMTCHPERQNTVILSPKGEGSQQDILAELKGDKVRNHVKKMIELSLMQPTWWNSEFNRNIDYLFFLSWYSQRCNPRRYLDFGVRRSCGAATVAVSCPSVEIYGIDKWEEVLNNYMPAREAFVLRRIGHQGYTRFIDGDIGTAVPRLRESFVGEFFFDLAFVQGDFLGGHLEQQLRDLLPYLSLGGALVLTCGSADHFSTVWNGVKKQFPQWTYVRCQSHATGMILTASSQNDESEIAMDENCLFNTSWLWLSRAKCWSVRGGRGLAQPKKYPEYMRRLSRSVRQKIPLSFSESARKK